MIMKKKPLFWYFFFKQALILIIYIVAERWCLKYDDDDNDSYTLFDEVITASSEYADNDDFTEKTSLKHAQRGSKTDKTNEKRYSYADTYVE